MRAHAVGDRGTGAGMPPGRGELGFTLVEMLVVLALLAVVTAASGIAVSGGRSGRLVASTAASLVGELARTRIDAIRSGRPRTVTFDAEARTVSRQGAAAMAIPEGVRIDLSTAREAAGAGSGGAAIAFLPDGRSSGGRIEIAMENARRTVTVTWLTGVIKESRP